MTHDLDFGALLAATRAASPSVVLLRVRDISTRAAEDLLVSVLRENEIALADGAIVTVEEARSRVRILPLR